MPVRVYFVNRICQTLLTSTVSVPKFTNNLPTNKNKIAVNRCHNFLLTFSKFNFGWGFSQNPACGAYSAPPDPLLDFLGKGESGKGRKEGKEGELRREEGREGKRGKKEREKRGEAEGKGRGGKGQESVPNIIPGIHPLKSPSTAL